jgi:hypothetical protein
MRNLSGNADIFGELSPERKAYGTTEESDEEWRQKIAPMLRKGMEYSVVLDGGSMIQVDGGDLTYTGPALYEYWRGVLQVSNEQNVRARGSELKQHARYAMGCVWIVGCKGCCNDQAALAANAKELGHRESVVERADWVHNTLAALYKADTDWPSPDVRIQSGRYKGREATLKDAVMPRKKFKPTLPYQLKFCGAERFTKVLGKCLLLVTLPPCAHCSWFGPWQANVMRCHEAGQQLYFAHLAYPSYPEQPKFMCRATGRQYYVGPGQAMELTWAQDMGIPVRPITLADTVPPPEYGFSVAELRAAGFGVDDFRRAGVSVVEMRENEITVGHLLAASYSAEEMKRAGCSHRDLLKGGYAIEAVKAAFPDIPL